MMQGLLLLPATLLGLLAVYVLARLVTFAYFKSRSQFELSLKQQPRGTRNGA